jgi:hypothetical protein
MLKQLAAGGVAGAGSLLSTALVVSLTVFFSFTHGHIAFGADENSVSSMFHFIYSYI